MQVLAGIGSSETTAAPTLSSASDLLSVITTITNYDAAYAYTVSATAGSYSRTGATITVTGLTNSQSTTVGVIATRTGYNPSGTTTSTASAIAGCTYTGYSYDTIAGGNCSTCGIICCGSGVPAYNFTYYQYTPYPCNLSGTKATGDVGYAGSWYCLTTGTGSGLSCGSGTPCGGSNGC